MGGSNSSNNSGSNAPTEQIAQYFTDHMTTSVNSQMTESFLTVDQRLVSSQRMVGWTFSLPPKGYCPVNAPPRNLTLTQRNDTAAAVALSASALRPDSLAKSLLNGLEQATGGTVDRSRPGVLNFSGPNVNQRLTVSDTTRAAVTNALGVKLGSYVSTTMINNQEQVNINIVMPCGNVQSDQTNLSRSYATDIASSVTEILMRAPEVRKFSEILAPELPPASIFDLVYQKVGNIPVEQIVAVLVLIGVVIFFAMSNDD